MIFVLVGHLWFAAPSSSLSMFVPPIVNVKPLAAVRDHSRTFVYTRHDHRATPSKPRMPCLVSLTTYLDDIREFLRCVIACFLLVVCVVFVCGVPVLFVVT